ncbi:UDP-N-acetylenolpyruvoylglucosamine reductase [Actinoplanes sp. SE50]|uniref:UDP-N-acetylmuramate dehydrogenase n=1 Tax=unclassified Actinoplanes TaxID=2626549 RepID=UPI00023EDF20|nr:MULTISPECIES: UDP-N-acetylmuramate dehydrogenase [unclassified Actinoplanes]AEV88817.1 UDP-N-acetylenolpyruvoylglucosamine reductase [Actinoplanes sp. SE50/110]ATO87223.1 UDP-N-acetylenolpyruvoylglucosamine reductase [Actinoplanes sp. SE50]SLM04641.1 UDP-N-acetylenolpyruvoylglucosamine reductase [Actinoplanes sp. SE50/110]
MPDAFADHLTDPTPAADRVLAAYTTLRLGGPAGTVTTAVETDEAVATVRKATAEGRPVLVLAGGSNVVIGDAGFAGEVLLLRTRGIEVVSESAGEAVVRVAAGEPWDDFVAYAVGNGLSGVECLSGIPGSAGATPIQNVGAYGQEVAHTIVAVHAYDRVADEQLMMSPADCAFGYRSSVFKHNDRYLVTAVDFRLARADRSAPIRYAELARQLGVEAGDRVPLEHARQTVLKLRAGKGMVLDPADRDTWSVGSFFTNPVVSAAFFAELTAARGEMPHWPGADGTVKVPAAWLIEHAGFPKGFAGAGVAISTKHTLALTHRGAGDTGALLDLARTIRDGVRDRFGITLHPEPVLVNCAL